MAAVSGERLFKFYWDNFFKFPRDIRNDLVYCQRALKAHLKVHQMVLDVCQQQGDADPAQKQRILDELELEIFEINAEQQFLLLRLRRIINEFNKMLRKNSVPADEMATNMCIASEVVPLISDDNFFIKPTTVSFRNTEEHLIARFFEAQLPTTVYEVSDSDDDANLPVTKKSTNTMINTRNAGKNCGGGGGGNMPSQKSLLKPMAQRQGGSGNQYADAYTQFVQATMPTTTAERAPSAEVSRKRTKPQPRFLTASHHSAKSTTALANEAPPTVELLESKKVKMSRLNLRQALKKAHNETMAAKAAAKNQTARATAAAPPARKADMKSISSKMQACAKQSVAVTTLTTTAEPAIVPTAESKREGKVRNTCNTATVGQAPELTLFSENSIPERDIALLVTTAVCTDYVDQRTRAEEIGQEMFLRVFDLFTPELIVQMQQRRSKRRRRNVHSNEREDFHYGRIQYGCPPPQEKKRRDFLLSPQVKRGLQAKRPKRISADKNQEVPTSRSNSSSPDEKRCCNECLKARGAMEQCVECKGYYHQGCHREEDDEEVIGGRSAAVKCPMDSAKQCPACKRAQLQLLKEDVKQYKALKETADELNSKMQQEQDRRVVLQKEGKQYKTQMSQLFNIVKTIKRVRENDSSE